MSRSWTVLFIVAVVGAGILFGLLDDRNKHELQQQGEAVYSWVNCKIDGGAPENKPVKDNEYRIVCNK